MLARGYSREEHDALLSLFDPHFYTRRRATAPATSFPTSYTADDRTPTHRHRRTASIASSVTSYFADRLHIPSPRPSRPASVLSKPQLAPLLSLPSEILLHILAFTLPSSHTRFTAGDRAHTLATLALVHPVLRNYAQNELFSTVYIASDRTVEQLTRLTCLPKSRGQELGKRITRLVVHGSLGTGDGGKALAKLVQQLVGLELLHLEDLDGLELRAFLLHPTLRTFSASRCGFRSRFRAVASSRPSPITSLSLTTCTGHHDSFSGFSLPNLSTLTIWDISLPPPSPLAVWEPSEAFRALAAEVGAQLRDVTVDEHHFNYLFPLPRLTQRQIVLHQLCIIKLSLLPLAIDLLPLPSPFPSTLFKGLKELHLVPPPSFLPASTSSEKADTHFGALLAPFHQLSGRSAGSIHPALKGLETLTLDWRYGAWDTSDSRLKKLRSVFPGGWSSSRWTEAPLRWRVLGKGKGRASDEDEEGEEEEDEGLVLPPPFLADDSPKESFDGLLGGRTSRRLSRLARHHARLYAQGRAPPPPFPHNVVKAAAKVVRLLGPPGGYDHRRPVLEREEGEKKGKGKGKGMSLDQAAQIVETALSKERRDEGGRQEERQRRRVKRAESGLRAYEIGVEVGRRVAGRLERHRSRRGELVSQLTAEGKRDEASRRSDSLVAATPAQLLGVPPSPSSVGGPIKGSSSSYPASTGDIDDIPPLPPAAPALRPLSIPDLPPLPTVATPFNLDPSSPDDYFALQKRRRTGLSSNSPSKLAAFAIPSTPKTPFILQPLPNPSPMRTALLDWVIFLLIGSPRSPTVAGFDSSLATVGGLIGILVHSLGFLFFVAYHLTTLLISSYGALRTTAVFIYWAGLNLSGRTEVSKAVVEYWRTCRSEWDKVVDEKGEDTVSVIAVLKGVLELAALHRMTRQRWLQDGPGHLKLLNGVNDVPTRLATPRFGPLRPRQSIDLERPSITQRQQSWRWTSNGGEEDGEGLVVTGHEGGILQGSIISHEEPRSLPSARSQKPSQASPDKRATINQLLEEEPPPLDLAEPEPSQLPASPPLQPIDERADPVADLVALIKRHCRLSTASYGLHTMLPSPPTPLLTPSGQTLPHRLFAHLGGLTDHRNVLHVALQKRYTGIPSVEDEIEATYAPQFYVLRDDLRAEVVVVIRGTQSLADVRTDLDGSLIPLDLPTPPTPASHEPQEPRTISSPYRIHSGILATARHLLSPVSTSPLYSKLAAILAEHPRYGLVFTGHSLGAALASSLAILLGEYNEAERRWVVSDSSSLASLSTPDSDRPPLFRRPVRAVCFAHPTTVNAPLSQYCATPNSPDGVPLVINVSLGADVICRMGIPQVKELRRAIGRLDKMRKRESSGILSSRREWAKLDRAIEEADDEEREQLERKREELVDCAWRLRCAAEGWLDGGDAVKEDDVDTAIPAGRCYHLDHLPPDVEVKRRAELRKAREVEGDESAGDDEDELLCGLYEVRDPRRFYAMPLLEADLVAAHMPKAYLDQVESL
ncbi:Proteophosphoglycan ppg4 [Rhodotorula toruloides ATCC 204091]|uniref:sn-1-specific diacylglycerol lipase n=1 Tax=Rhodotorula toruloides TaxID=5286 RepID=A0A0K3CCK7_RHOTO|nr:Proteophosphoglycan ppg4 [Rhodotorula toruloides ATCC 204091]